MIALAIILAFSVVFWAGFKIGWREREEKALRAMYAMLAARQAKGGQG